VTLCLGSHIKLEG